MEFKILGRVRIRSGDAHMPLGPPKQRLLMAALLAHPHDLVSVDRLVDVLWGPAPPPSAQANLRLYVRGLRQALGADRVIREGHGGYRLRVTCDEVDACRFVQLVRQGTATLADGGDVVVGRDLLREALRLWEGTPYAGLPVEAGLPEERTRLEEWHLVAVEQRIDADLRLGQDASLVAELKALVAANAFRERLWLQLMLALYRSGRRAEALETYRRVRDILADELGLEPGPELRRLEKAVLNGDPGPAATSGDRRDPLAGQGAGDQHSDPGHERRMAGDPPPGGKYAPIRRTPSRRS